MAISGILNFATAVRLDKRHLTVDARSSTSDTIVVVDQRLRLSTNRVVAPYCSHLRLLGGLRSVKATHSSSSKSRPAVAQLIFCHAS